MQTKSSIVNMSSLQDSVFVSIYPSGFCISSPVAYDCAVASTCRCYKTPQFRFIKSDCTQNTEVTHKVVRLPLGL